VIAGDQLRISHAGREIAVHQRRTGRFERVIDPVHFDGVVGSGPRAPVEIAAVSNTLAAPELLRPLLRSFEAASYGHRAPDRPMYAQAAEAAQRYRQSAA